jgi:predicted Zn-dependent protease
MTGTVRTTVVAFLLFLALVAGCSEVPITGRRQLRLVPESMVTSMAVQQYDQFLSQSKVSRDVEKVAMVKRVGNRIQQAVEEFCRQYCDENPFAGYAWEFNLIAEDSVNAWAMPGGKVVVYEGILPVTQDEAGLATVMGHEIAHVFADHGQERMSQQLLTQMGGMALDYALKEKPEETRNLFMTSYGLGTQVGYLLPFSRLHENEADRLGLIFMAMAGYDPHEAVGFWQRMAQAKEGAAQPPEFLSTHPADETRIRKIQELIPEAMEYYQPRTQ